MNYAQAFAQYEAVLAANGVEKAALTYVFNDWKDWSRLDFILHQSHEIPEADLRQLDRITKLLKQHIPAQYITKKAYFADLTLTVDERVLIPRPETEELVNLILEENPDESLTVLDIGTGSGAIAIALAKTRKNWQISASDISKKALLLAQDNARANQTAVNFLHSDVFSQISDKYDIIVSNPPYIAFEDRNEVGQNVLLHEPHLALFADNEGLSVYQKIAEGAAEHLTAGGRIYLEIGYKQGASVSEIFRNYFSDKRIRLLQDSFGKDRMVVIDDG
ncbi:peptide chain release factor N(5)-glutamine methyltransferase [Streptococcus ratti]|uniref:Release factor glutamine methyltransferase n=1 Tax=Streptococcus ratti FA-1 = DSM 20564 TaxID=699248 RepID=A0ABP2QY35_STRRT|nr:peptide chain release factor N(5)-glutamine methyltransferase [Streptococcus ratti]EJN93922.1 putative protoporphyrinogen oxidase [Streptococcus ratti FA-1 = DSM 20564]EMP71146.1 N5-glutamine S-adenosyl-L-methionine-dependent methyltransferase [Streptococcus ratti FA-1 = DSM 20564]QEY07768.1 peptide chain release factor N(5)-glutamine methyltransferase [Streptococcus ratti]VEI60231.1 putative protoporphyrinogen oxidase [Streptococcus mutans]